MNEVRALLAARRAAETMLDRAVDRNLGRACQALLREVCAEWYRLGFIREHRLLASYELASTTLILFTETHQQLRYDISDDEIRMGGMDGFRQWLEQIDRELLLRFGFNPRPGGVTWIDEFGVPTPSKADREAEKKAQALFISVAGRACFDALEQGKAWQIKGSKTHDVYELRKKASFCIRRQRDGVDFCAVVPGVPLWDHLLGIKLMIEHDEPRFLRIANKSMGQAAWYQHAIVNPPLIWGGTAV